LLSGLSDRQWREAFLAGGFSPAAAEPFLTVIQARLAQAASVGELAGESAGRTR
jgi:hypothetical protein